MITGYDVVYVRQDNSTGSVTGGNETPEQTKKLCKDDIDYYLSIGYTIKSADLLTYCETCKGGGKIYKRKNKKLLGIYMDCPTCKNKPILTRVPYSND